jgi:RNA polymerase sigma-70 factor (ECF subfamily)
VRAAIQPFVFSVAKRPALQLVERRDELHRVPSIDEAFRQYSRYVGAVGLRILGRPSEVDDLVQEVFVEAARNWGTIREPGPIKAWLARITVRTARRRLKRRRLWETTAFFRSTDELEVPNLDHSATPEERALLVQLYRVLDSLPVEDRLAFCLRHLEGEPLEEVAALCRCSLATAKRRVSRAMDALRGAVDV